MFSKIKTHINLKKFLFADSQLELEVYHRTSIKGDGTLTWPVDDFIFWGLLEKQNEDSLSSQPAGTAITS